MRWVLHAEPTVLMLAGADISGSASAIAVAQDLATFVLLSTARPRTPEPTSPNTPATT
eukprot:COSAG01_NODE_6737_length_3522_cov_24.246567_4_plen_58_part_00